MADEKIVEAPAEEPAAEEAPAEEPVAESAADPVDVEAPVEDPEGVRKPSSHPALIAAILRGEAKLTHILLDEIEQRRSVQDLEVLIAGARALLEGK